MPKYKIKNDVEVEELEVSLEEDDGAMALYVNGQIVLWLTPSGRLCLEDELDEDLGLKLNKRGEIQMTDSPLEEEKDDDDDC